MSTYPLLIHDGLEQIEYSLDRSVITGLGTCINPSTYISFSKWDQQIHVLDMQKILLQAPQLKESFIPGHYKGTDELSSYFRIFEDQMKLVIISYGEFQPARYKLYVEAILPL